MRIALDATVIGFGTEDKGGVYHYILNLIQALKAVSREHQYFLFLNFFRAKHLQASPDMETLLQGDNVHLVFSRLLQEAFQPNVRIDQVHRKR